MYTSSLGTTAATTTTSYHQQQQQRHHAYLSSTGSPSAAANLNELHQSASASAHRQSMGVAVLPSAFNRSFYAERQKLKSSGDSSQDLDSANSSLSSSRRGTGNGGNASHANGSGGEMTDSQRSLSEGRLVDSDYSRDGLSQSHDSVFSESATASSLSIVLKAELADVLRKRRNRPDASDEDLGLPRSPASPQRRAERITTTTANGTTPSTGGGNHSEVSSLSLLSMNSADGDEFLASSTANNSMHNESNSSATAVQDRSISMVSASRYSRSSTLSSISLSSDILRNKNEPRDELDLFSSDWQRLSHSAAKHKMAVRPAKKKGPSRQHRRTLETSIPEANEELFKIGGNHLLSLIDKDAKAKTRSLPPGVNAKILELHAEDKNTSTASETINIKTTTPTSIATTTEHSSCTNSKRSKTEKSTSSSVSQSSSKTTSTTASSSFGLRALTSKATAIFEPKTEAPPISCPAEETKDMHATETTESGFLRRLIQRNSKRTISKANGDDELDNQSEPKKLQISTSAYEQRPAALLPSLDKCKSAVTYDQKVEETRKEIKREIMSEGKTGLSAMLNTFILAPTSINGESGKPKDSTPKPKSGPAARQRYLPQEIFTVNTLEKNTARNGTTTAVAKDSFSSNTLLNKTSSEEKFQSTSIIREITAAQATLTSSKSDHHFEKKPKIIGLSAFQQKISRSNDSSARSSSNNTSTNSLEVTGEAVFLNYEQKQRKSVEKSRSFRTYIEDREASMHNNMPSLPDLTLNLRVPSFGDFIMNDKEYSSPSPPDPNDKSMSLGFEINDNNLVRPAMRAESENILTPSPGSAYGKQFVLTTKNTHSKLLTPTAMMPSISPTNSVCNDISEIEQNIDMIVKSPFVSVLRKSATNSNEMTNKLPTLAGSNQKKYEEPAQTSQNQRPTVLQIKEIKAPADTTKLSPTSNAITVVPMREKAIATIALKINSESSVKDVERKSIGTANPATSNGAKTNSFNCARRSSSVVESTTEPSNPGVPEFMKIQLNRVDPGTRMPKSTVVLAKNVKENSVIKDAVERSSSIDDLSLRRFSNESVEITENETPDTEKQLTSVLFEAINKQTKSVSTSSIRYSSNSELPPKSPVKKSPTTPTTPTTPTFVATPVTTPTTDTEERVILRNKPPKPSDALTVANKLSLQERKRLFMNEEKTKMDKKIEELKNERKKSITEEVFRKSLIKTEDQNDRKKSITEEIFRKSNFKMENKEVSSPTTLEPIEKDVVIMRKKSLVGAHQTSSLNGNCSNTTTTTTTVANKDDPTPELMKVFARRSLKIKDEDVAHLADKILAPVHQLGPLKKFSPAKQNVDSDKENQSSSEEKLDKLPKFEVAIEQANGGNKVSSASNNSVVTNSNRNSLADFRNGVTNKNGVSNGLALSSSHNNNNNVTTSTTLPSKGHGGLPPMRITGFRHGSIDRTASSATKLSTTSIESMNNNNNSNHNNFNNNSKSILDRQSLNIRSTTESANAGVSSKTIERSATVGEFKGIHQRRAEWEQRAKEALK